jgi:transcriptional regulator with XRE-family HTH domain
MPDWRSWDTLGRRVKGRRKDLKLTQEQLAKAAGLSQADVSKIERGEIQQPAKVPQLARALQCDAIWLSEGGDQPDTDGAIAHRVAEQPTQYLPGFEPLSITLLSTGGSMGLGSEQHDEVVIGRLTVSPHWAVKTLKPTKLENLRFIHGYGDSMEPTFSDGDILLVDTGIRSCDVDGVYVLEANQRLFIKRVTERFDGVHEITSDNPSVKTVQALDGSQQVDILGRVIWTWNGKKI